MFKEANLGYLEGISEGNIGIIKEIIDIFLTQTPTDLQILHLGILNKDWAQVKSISHHIKPTLAYVGANDLKAALHKFEILEMNQDGNIEKIQKEYEDILCRFKVLFEELRTYLKNNQL